jgi:pSer/pThr/pTyr-binding forkhead associated (FHA) protein
LLEVIGAGSRHAVPASGLTLGSGPDNAVVLADRRVSRAHAVVRPRGRAVVLTDLRSTNGTEVNGRRVTTATLRDGDRIVLGGTIELVYRQ